MIRKDYAQKKKQNYTINENAGRNCNRKLLQYKFRWVQVATANIQVQVDAGRHCKSPGPGGCRSPLQKFRYRFTWVQVATANPGIASATIHTEDDLLHISISCCSYFLCYHHDFVSRCSTSSVIITILLHMCMS